MATELSVTISHNGISSKLSLIGSQFPGNLFSWKLGGMVYYATQLLEGRDWEQQGWRSAQAKSYQDCISTNNLGVAVVPATWKA
jgi:hypothetical protein